MMYVFRFIYGFSALVLVAWALPVCAQPIPEDEAERLHQQAVERFEQQETEQDAVAKTARQPQPDVQVWSKELPKVEYPDKSHPHYPAGAAAAEIHLGDVSVQVNLEDVTLQQALARVVNQAASLTGPWQLKWRLDPENQYLLDERVNVIAEVTFNEFVSFLVERVKNMTGVNLYVAVFEGSRVIVVSDTYY